MGYTIKFEHPQFPDGYEFGINDLGMVKNNETLEITEDMESQFVNSRGMPLKDALEHIFGVTLEGSSALPDDKKEDASVTESPASSDSPDNAAPASSQGEEPTVATPPADGGESQ